MAGRARNLNVPIFTTFYSKLVTYVEKDGDVGIIATYVAISLWNQHNQPVHELKMVVL